MIPKVSSDFRFPIVLQVLYIRIGNRIKGLVAHAVTAVDCLQRNMRHQKHTGKLLQISLVHVQIVLKVIVVGPEDTASPGFVDNPLLHLCQVFPHAVREQCNRLLCLLIILLPCILPISREYRGEYKNFCNNSNRHTACKDLCADRYKGLSVLCL